MAPLLTESVSVSGPAGDIFVFDSEAEVSPLPPGDAVFFGSTSLPPGDAVFFGSTSLPPGDGASFFSSTSPWT